MPSKRTYPKLIDPREANGAFVGRAVDEQTGEVLATVTISAEEAAQMAARAEALRPLLRQRFEIEQMLSKGATSYPPAVRRIVSQAFSVAFDGALETIRSADAVQRWLSGPPPKKATGKVKPKDPQTLPRGRKTPTPRAKAA